MARWLGNIQPDIGVLFLGRGSVQLTGRSNVNPGEKPRLPAYYALDDYTAISHTT